MNEQEITKIAKEQENVINNILIDSSLYLGMSSAERIKLLHYLLSSYFDLLPFDNVRALPTTMRTGSEM